MVGVIPAVCIVGARTIPVRLPSRVVAVVADLFDYRG
jgi:hypothetical protein